MAPCILYAESNGLSCWNLKKTLALQTSAFLVLWVKHECLNTSSSCRHPWHVLFPRHHVPNQNSLGRQYRDGLGVCRWLVAIFTFVCWEVELGARVDVFWWHRFLFLRIICETLETQIGLCLIASTTCIIAIMLVALTGRFLRILAVRWILGSPRLSWGRPRIHCARKNVGFA